jgi:hypothetical protein
MLYLFLAVFPPIIRSSNCAYSIWYMSYIHDIYQMLYAQLELLMMGGKTA